MPYSFKNTNIITGYIKELLKDFNLPVYPVVSDTLNLQENRIYIYNSNLVCRVGNEIKNIDGYIFNKPYENATKNLVIKSNIYDSYTHEYLGDFLRFIRDYKKLNLMPLYNCFSNTLLQSMNQTFRISKSREFIVNANSEDYKYYLIPIKFNQEYTISLNCRQSYEIAAMLYTGADASDASKAVVRNSYKKIPGSNRNKPYLFSVSDIIIDGDGNNLICWPNEPDLKLVIKLPAYVKTGITVLEGNYLDNTSFNNTYVTHLGDENDEVIFGPETYSELIGFTKLSLLETQSTESFPFADRLVEYLLGNVITPLDTIPGDVGTVQKKIYADEKLKEKKFKGIYDIFDDNIRKRLFEISRYEELKKNGNKILNIGAINKFIETSEGYITERVFENSRLVDSRSDLLYYIDKDMEKAVQGL